MSPVSPLRDHHPKADDSERHARTASTVGILVSVIRDGMVYSLMVTVT
jgi:hypothetical protein